MPIAAQFPITRRAFAAGLALLVAACASRTPAPVVERQQAPPPRTAVAAPPPVVPAPPPPAEPEVRAPTYTVKRGDTLFQIALDQGLDYRELSAWNNLDNPNLIRVGQVLRLSAPGSETATAATGVTTTPLRGAPPVSGSAAPGAGSPAPVVGAATPTPAGPRNAENYKSSPKAIKEPYSSQAAREIGREPSVPLQTDVSPPIVARVDPPPRPAAPVIASDDDKLGWVWPTQGRVVAGFSDTANLKGVDIAGSAGQPVVASAAGKVVYAGAGLRGYGKLVIIKHNDTFLSAYAHNKDIAVKEGDQVARGQKIAEMGNTDADQVKLHFEIRRLGKPMDPLKYLPPA